MLVAQHQHSILHFSALEVADQSDVDFFVHGKLIVASHRDLMRIILRQGNLRVAADLGSQLKCHHGVGRSNPIVEVEPHAVGEAIRFLLFLLDLKPELAVDEVIVAVDIQRLQLGRHERDARVKILFVFEIATVRQRQGESVIEEVVLYLEVVGRCKLVFER